MKNPSFGEYDPDQTYQFREAVYAVVANALRTELLLVQAPNGAYFLPGGGIEKAEDQLATLQREAHEEIGCRLTIGPYLGRADEFFYSRHRASYFHNPGYFYVCLDYQRIGEPLEKTNQLAWFPVAEAKEKLRRGSHRWAVEAWEAYWENTQKN